MTTAGQAHTGRREQLLERAYRYVLEQGLADMSLRPLAAAVGSSPRVLLYLFGSKDGLVRALLDRARRDELTQLDAVRTRIVEARGAGGAAGLSAAVGEVWGWLADDRHRPLLVLWVEAYARSLSDPGGPWGGFAAATVRDWLDVLAAAQRPEEREDPAGVAQRTAALAVLRGAMIDLLATGDTGRVGEAVRRYLTRLEPAAVPSGTAEKHHTDRPRQANHRLG